MPLHPGDDARTGHGQRQHGHPAGRQRTMAGTAQRQHRVLLPHADKVQALQEQAEHLVGLLHTFPVGLGISAEMHGRDIRSLEHDQAEVGLVALQVTGRGFAQVAVDIADVLGALQHPGVQAAGRKDRSQPVALIEGGGAQLPVAEQGKEIDRLRADRPRGAGALHTVLLGRQGGEQGGQGRQGQGRRRRQQATTTGPAAAEPVQVGRAHRGQGLGVQAIDDETEQSGHGVSPVGVNRRPADRGGGRTVAPLLPPGCYDRVSPPLHFDAAVPGRSGASPFLTQS